MIRKFVLPVMTATAVLALSAAAASAADYDYPDDRSDYYSESYYGGPHGYHASDRYDGDDDDVYVEREYYGSSQDVDGDGIDDDVDSSLSAGQNRSGY